MKKKILIFNVNLKKGGMENQLSILLKNIDYNKFKVTLVLFENVIEFSLPEEVELKYIKRTRKYSISFLIRIFNMLKKEKYDLVISKNREVNNLLMIFGVFIKKINLILEIRSSGKALLPYYKIMKIYYDYLGCNFNIVSNNSRAKKEIEKIINKKVNINVINNGINVERFFPAKKNRSDHFHIGFIGRVVSVKNIETIIKAINYLRFTKENISPYKISIIGPIYNSNYEAKLIDLISSFNLEDKIFLVGESKDLVQSYNSLDLFVLPSEREGLSNSLLEAMSCGVMCAVSNQADTEKLIDNDFCFKVGNYKKLSKIILKCYNMKQIQRKTISDKLRKIIVNNYPIDLFIKKYTKLWSDL